jgi:steroid 5-alpha reductase family enzyme
MNSPLLNLLWETLQWGMAPALLLFALTWLAAWKIDNWSIVDVVWSYGFAILIALPFAVGAAAAGWSSLPSRWLDDPLLWLSAAMVLWSLRLGTHLGIRVLGHLDKEDGRYLRMREVHGKRMAWKMAIFYLQQAVALVVLMLPFYAASTDAEGQRAGAVHLAGLVLFLAGLAFEATGDSQLARFKADPANRGKVCDVGLWAWTRHPNYFGEFLIWLGFALLSFTPNLLGIPGLLCAGVILYLVTNVTGIPLTEQQLLTSKGDAYRDYQRRVSAFWPRPPRG